MRTAMHQAVHDDAWLFELPDGDFLGPGLSTPVGAPYDPQACSALLLRWFDAGLIELHQDTDFADDSLTDPAIDPDPPAADLPLIPPEAARALLADPTRWTDETPEGFAALPPTERGRSTPADRWP